MKKLTAAAGGAQRAASLLFTLAGMLWLAAFPLMQGGTYAHITRDKWQIALVLTGVTLLLALPGLILSWGAETGPASARRRLLVWMPALLLLIWMTLSAMLAPYHLQRNSEGQLAVWMGSRRYEGLSTQLCYAAIFLCMSLRPLRLRWVSRAAACSLLVFLAIVLLQYAGGNPLGLYPTGRSIRTNYEFQGTIGNIDMISGYTVLVTGLCCGGFLGSGKPEPLLCAGAAAGFFLLCAIEVQSGLLTLCAGATLLLAAMLYQPALRSRGWLLLGIAAASALMRALVLFPWLDSSESVRLSPFSLRHAALLALAAFCFAAAAFRRLHPGRRPRAWPAILAGCLALCLAAALLLPLTPADGGLWEMQETLKGRPQDSFGSWRMGVWRVTLQMAGENLLLGTGPDTFWYAFNKPWWIPLENELHRTGALPQTVQLERFDSPHNEYLAYLANEGLPALLLYLALLAGTLALGVRAARRQPALWGLPAAVLFFAIQAFFSFSIAIVSPMYWAVLGMTAAAGIAGDRKDDLPCW